MADVEIECRNLWKIYGAREKEALEAVQSEGLSKEEVRDRFNCVLGVRNASFSVNKGEIFCIMGLSGSGKSTLVRHINRLIEPTAGEIHVAGHRVDTMGEAELRKLRAESIGMVFQHMALWPHRSLAENVGFGLEVRDVPLEKRRKAAEEALAAMDLQGWEDHYPDQLSGGMQQRVGLARALAADPDILLMDEPFSALDPLIRRQLQDQFLELSRKLKKTTVFITHDLDEAIRMGDQIAIMNDGVIVQTGTPEEIVTNPKDDYVAEFVKGISRVNLVRAKTIMSPLEWQSPTAKTVPLDCELSEIMDQFMDDQTPVTVLDTGNKPAGIITIADALRALRG
ncbi:quaternary amine ABC transporter ATP-binding protein [Sulfitobacter donghicola]|uniref:Quaternary amine transport ATP-binding protein n=1 Tax=Sulfitobacter donghicola DSW-25 = KCTC 12864 = JCM 14565 TaxID=1300350 RepID=A0A073IGL0_9RHOB|nr:betaine/proline/choline family ABC transporter ATP-binding protein [Sulfitobacter donghicola]KEJ88626.1 glycine/betaine ABC transporter [Sulfitobacter donghicola DSW-25 = KCTC 12864 = JCM 14565]KIN68386.1 Glycine betaine/L-proline ABC transporter, ATPase subunit [Sulfitobacter donghicola DSW-25 = KCTC 12864 = JCM 14565]